MEAVVAGGKTLQPLGNRMRSGETIPALTFPRFEPHFLRENWTLPAVLAHHAAIRPDAPFLSWTDAEEPLTFAGIDHLTNRIANSLARRGIAKGDRIALFLPNCRYFVPIWFAIAKLGAIEVPIGDTSKGDFLRHQLAITEPKLILTTRELSLRIDEVTVTRDCYETIVVPMDEEADVAPHGATSFEELLAGDPEPVVSNVASQDLSTILFTSGTTGPSKGVLMSHAQMYFFAEECAQMTRLTHDDVYMTSFPLIHGNAQILSVYAALIPGARCVVYPRFSASDWSRRVRASGATVTNTLGATMSFICAQPEGPNDRNNHLRCVYAAPLAPDLESIFRDRFGNVDFVNAFGQTEISLPFVTPPGAEVPEGAVGVLVDQWFDVMLADSETDEPVAAGCVGELLVRPKVPNIICSGYAGMPEETVKAWRNLWFHTGDAMRCDAGGWYYFVDRVKDALRRRGENISSFEVESVVRAHPDIEECAVVAAPAQEVGGEDEVKVCVIIRQGADFDPTQLIAWCDERLPYFMVPRYVETLDSLPRTASEKIQKKLLRDRGVTPQTWDRIAANCLLDRETRVEATTTP